MHQLDLHRQEIETLRLCQFPYIVSMKNVFEDSENLYISMEYLKGGDLSAYLDKQSHKLAEERVKSIVITLLKAVEFMHSHGIAHRDLKPKNILLIDDTPDSDVKIADFGLAVCLEPIKKCQSSAGTPNFVAPETLLGFPSDQAVDMWSMGIITHLLLTGKLPFPEAESLSSQKS